MAKDFALDDLVWAKMKGFPPWPAKIYQPPDGNIAKSKKSQHFVFFFGTHDVAWIADEFIFPHSERMLLDSSNYKKKSTTLQAAIDEIKEESLKVPPKPSKKPSSEKDKKEPSCSTSSGLDSIPGTSKTGKKEQPGNKILPLESTPTVSKPPKKTLIKKKMIEKKRPKKRPAPDDDKGLNSLKAEDNSLMVANVPPNNALPSVDVLPHHSGQIALTANVTEPYSLVPSKPKPKKLPPNKKKIGFIGLGVMGSQMVRLLLKSKHNVTVWNRTIEKCDEFVKLGARRAESPADLVRACDIIFCCVANPEALKVIFFLKNGVMEGFSGGGSSKDIGNKGYVEMTSIDPTTSQEISEAICGEGGRYLEAPMLGSRQELENGSILIVGSGDRNLFTECDTCFNVWARHAIYYSSDVGNASKINLLVSMVLGTTYAAVAEALALVEKCGVQPVLFMNALGDGPLNCPLVMDKGHAMLKKNSVVERPVKHLQKDLDIAVSLSTNYDQPLVLTVAANETFKRAKREFSEEDVSAVHKIYKF